MLSTPIVPCPDYDNTYEPAEDSFLFLDLFESLHESKHFQSIGPGKIVLEVGSGTGIISAFLSQHKIVPNALLLATDINPHAVTQTKKTSPLTEVINCNLTDAIMRNAVDVLFFNPPYVPSEDIPDIPKNLESADWLDLALVGGDDGMEITNILLDKLPDILTTNGEAYILFCARNNHPKVVEDYLASHSDFTVEKVIHRKCGWEELAIYRFKKN